MHDIFVSYPRRDRGRVLPIVESLQGLGFTCFFDAEDIDGGRQFPDIIDRAVKAARSVLGLWSPYGLTRDWVKNECRIGHTRGVLITAQLEEIEPLEIPAEFGAPHLVDLRGFDGAVGHRGFLEIIRIASARSEKVALYQLAEAALGQAPAIDALQRARQSDEKIIRAAWDDLKSSSNVERILQFRENHAKGSLLEYAIDERLEAIAIEFLKSAEELYPTLSRSKMLSNLRSADYWRPPRYDSYSSYGLAVAPAYDQHASSARDAFKLYLKAAELGNALAMGYVAVMMQSGSGVSKDTYRAGQWCTRALKALT